MRRLVYLCSAILVGSSIGIASAWWAIGRGMSGGIPYGVWVHYPHYGSVAANPYTRALLAASPAPDPRLPAPAVLSGEPPSALTPTPGCVFHKRCPERLARCASEAPPETLGGREPNHRVRCFLCNP